VVNIFEKAKNSVEATPALVIDLARVRKNLTELEEHVRPLGIKVRPHTKTHKSKRLAQEQLDSGSVGLTVAKVGEAEVMAQVCDDILIAYPIIDPHRSARAAKLAHDVTVRVALDTKFGIDAIANAAKKAGSTIGILVDLNVGSNRTGVATPQELLELAQHVEQCGKSVRLDGIFFYPGHIWVPADQQPPLLKLVDEMLLEAKDLFNKSGLCTDTVSGGSRQSAFRSQLITAQTEIRSGTHIFNDMNTVRVGACSLDQCAASIICTVVSNAVAGKVILDAGSKTITSDRNVSQPDSGYGHLIEYPDAIVSSLSEEHGEIDIRNCKNAPDLGERVTLIPNHVCPCVNLREQVWLQTEQGLESIPVDTRGMTT